MKPVKLILKNIGPFLDECLDFTQLEDMFLVTGKTGSGKTTIFDAMTFALFGKLCGARDGYTANFRSDFAPPDEDAYVEFTFRLNNREIRVTRTVEGKYINRNNRESTRPSTVTLEFKDKNGTWNQFIGNKVETDARIAGEVGLSCDEFAKIVVLPQGEFARFLKENSTNKSITLAKLFPVSIYTDIIKSIDTKSKTALSQLKLLETQLSENKEMFDPDATAEKILMTENNLAGAKKQQEEYQAMNEELVKKLTEISKKLESARKAAELEEKLVELKAQENEIKELKKSISDAESAQKLLSPFTALENTEKHLKEAEKQFEEIKEKEECVRENKLQLEAIKPLSEHKKDFHNKLIEYAAGVRNAVPVIRQQEEALSKKQTLTVQVEALCAEYEWVSQELNIALQEQEKEVLELKSTINSTQTLISDLEAKKEKQADEDKAYALVKLLEPGKPCPVCGSTEHPLPAKAVVLTNSFDENIKAAKNNLKLAQDKIADETGKLQLLKEQQEQCMTAQQEIIEITEKLGMSFQSLCSMGGSQGNGKYSEMHFKEMLKTISKTKEACIHIEENLSASLTEDIKIIDCPYADVQKLLPVLPQVQSSRAMDEYAARLLKVSKDFENDIKEYEKLKEQTETTAAGIQASKKACEEQLAKCTKENETALELFNEQLSMSGFTSKDEFIKKLLDESTLASFRNRIEKHAADIAQTEGQMKSMEVNAKDSIELQEKYETLKNEQAELKAASTKNTELQENYNKDLVTMRNGIKRGQELNLQLQKAQNESSTLLLLNRAISGENPKKIRLDSWILSTFLERIVTAANLRFRTISSNRYRFVLVENKEKGRGNKGLDLNVIDSNTGKERPTSSLSGGETFMASLSLALALTDVVQQNSGGIKLDSLFIDEGFGTLDNESLDSALDILSNIREQRMVGIISHVESLRQAIPCHVEVKKENTGSSITTNM